MNLGVVNSAAETTKEVIRSTCGEMIDNVLVSMISTGKIHVPLATREGEVLTTNDGEVIEAWRDIRTIEVVKE